MSSRTEILSKIKKNKPESVQMPLLNFEEFSSKVDKLTEFKKMVENVGGKMFSANSNNAILNSVEELFPNSMIKYSVLKESDGFNTIDIKEIENPHDLEALDVLVLKGVFGVAENGAIWVSDLEMPMRVLPFITKHLVLVLNKNKMVTDMHQAYKIISDFDYGLFISGPSKTADIEQSLVIGAQGALSLSVFLMED